MMSSEETKKEQRLQLVEELANLVEALRDEQSGPEMIETLEEKGELRLYAILGASKTIVVIKNWTKEELAELKHAQDAEWPEYLTDEQNSQEG